MYAVIEAGGSQHKVEEGELLTIDRLHVDGKAAQAGEDKATVSST